MSSHREAPSISKDANADNTDVYAFVNPTNPKNVTLIANFIPFELPYGGPNFSEFADEVTYAINVTHSADAVADVSFEFTFSTKIVSDKTFLYNTGPIGKAPGYANWNRPQTYTVTRVTRIGSKRTSKVMGKGLPVPPVNVGARSTPDYNMTYSADAISHLGHGVRTFAGQRADAFTVDLGSIFDLGGIRPLNSAHAYGLDNMPGVNGLSGLNVHTLAIDIPIAQLTKNGDMPTDPSKSSAVIGVWATASRARTTVLDPATGERKAMGGQVQVSRLANPLFNELITPMAYKDKWNASRPHLDKHFAKYVATPELAGLLPALYPKAFPNLAAFNAKNKPRADLEAVLLTGIPYGILKDANGDNIPFTTFISGTQADLLRLNVAVPASKPGDTSYSKYGLLGNDLGGFPNGRRVGDDVTAIELRAIAGATIPLIPIEPYKSFVPDAPVATLTDGSENEYYTNPKAGDTGAPGNFPFMPAPNGGYATTPLLGSTGGTTGVEGAPDNGGTGDGT